MTDRSINARSRSASAAIKRNFALLMLCLFMLMIFGYSFWIGARNTPGLVG